MKTSYATTVAAVTAAGATFMAIAFVSCGSDDGGGGNNATTVNVTLQEFSVTPDRSSAPDGRITFHVSNVGEDMHEFLVIRTDLAPDALPTEANGSYEEDGAGTDLLDEIEDVEPGNSADLTLDLDEGNYVLICNMVHLEEGGEVEIHYQLGMRTAFSVD